MLLLFCSTLTICYFVVRDSVGFKLTHICQLGLSGSFAVNVIDSLIIVHHQASKVSAVVHHQASKLSAVVHHQASKVSAVVHNQASKVSAVAHPILSFIFE